MRGSDVGDEAMIKLFCAPHARSLTSHITLEEARAPYTVVRVHFAPRIRVGPREKAALAICWMNSKVAVPSSRSFHPKVETKFRLPRPE
jgi:hypothetical protein